MTFTARILPFPANPSVPAKTGNRVLPPVPDATEGLSGCLTGNTLVIADAENIMFSARDHGLRVDFRHLARRLSPNGTTQLHAAFSRLDPARNPMFQASLLLGRDVLYAHQHNAQGAASRTHQTHITNTDNASQTGDKARSPWWNLPSLLRHKLRRQPNAAAALLPLLPTFTKTSRSMPGNTSPTSRTLQFLVSD